VLLGGAATLALGAFALVPTKDLRLKPSKPLYFYLVQLLRVEVGGGVAGFREGCLSCHHPGEASGQGRAAEAPPPLAALSGWAGLKQLVAAAAWRGATSFDARPGALSHPPGPAGGLQGPGGERGLGHTAPAAATD
jgi:hypothetical protein